MLSDADRCKIYVILKDDLSNRHSLVLAETAFALGVDRARRVKPLVWMQDPVSLDWKSAEPAPDRRYVVFFTGVRWSCRFNTNVFASHDTEAKAGAACYEHQCRYVLSMLEDV